MSGLGVSGSSSASSGSACDGGSPGSVSSAVCGRVSGNQRSVIAPYVKLLSDESQVDGQSLTSTEIEFLHGKLED